jgi:hypothetical protein
MEKENHITKAIESCGYVQEAIPGPRDGRVAGVGGKKRKRDCGRSTKKARAAAGAVPGLEAGKGGRPGYSPARSLAPGRMVRVERVMTAVAVVGSV